MPRLTNCPKCHKIVAVEDPVCPSCGLEKPRGGWLAYQHSGLNSKRSKLQVIPALFGVALVGFMVWLFWTSPSTSNAGSSKPKKSYWSPDIGKRATLNAGAILCPSYDLLQKFADEYVNSREANDKVGERNATIRAALKGCYPAPHSEGVLVIDLQGLSRPAARLRLKDGSAGWVFDHSLGPEQ